ncbi:hypothetical protein [Spirosoma gilvum]
MVPQFFPVPGSLANVWDFKPGLGYEIGLSRMVSLKTFELEPGIRYAHNVLKQPIMIVNQALQPLPDSRNVWTVGNKVIEISILFKKQVSPGGCKFYLIAGPFCQFRKNETLHNQLGDFSFPLEKNRFEYGLDAGLETTGILSFRLMGQFSRTVFASTIGSYHGSTFSFTARYNISSFIRRKKVKKVARMSCLPTDCDVTRPYKEVRTHESSSLN